MLMIFLIAIALKCFKKGNKEIYISNLLISKSLPEIEFQLRCGYCAGLLPHSKRVRTLVGLLRSLSDEYPWERIENHYNS